MAANPPRSLRCTQTAIYETVLELDQELKSTIQHIENLGNGTAPERANIIGALLLLNDTYESIIHCFEESIVQLKELWGEKRFKHLYSFVWMVKNFQIATSKWKKPISEEKNLEEYRERLLRRAQFLVYIAAKFQQRVLKNVENDNREMRLNTLDTDRLRESLRKGQRNVVLEIMSDYKRYNYVATTSLIKLVNDSLIYRNGYKCIWGYYTACEMCLIIRTELFHYSDFYNGRALNAAIAKIDPRNVAGWYTRLPNFEDAVDHLKTINPDFKDMKRNYHFKVLNSKNSRELAVEFLKLSLWCKSILLKHRLDLVDAFIKAKDALPMNSVAFNAAYNLYETTLEFFWRAKAVIDRRAKMEEASLDHFLWLIDHIHVFGFSIAVPVHLLRKLGELGSPNAAKVPKRLSTSTGSVNTKIPPLRLYVRREPAIILKSEQEKAKVAARATITGRRQPVKIAADPSRATGRKQTSKIKPPQPTAPKPVTSSPKQPPTKKLKPHTTVRPPQASTSGARQSQQTVPKQLKAVILSQPSTSGATQPPKSKIKPPTKVKSSQSTAAKPAQRSTVKSLRPSTIRQSQVSATTVPKQLLKPTANPTKRRLSSSAAAAQKPDKTSPTKKTRPNPKNKSPRAKK